MDRTHLEVVSSGQIRHRLFHSRYFYIDRPPATLTNQVMMSEMIVERVVTEMDHTRSVPKMDVMEQALRLECIDAPVDRRGHHLSPDPPIDSLQEGRGSEMVEMRLSQHFANRPSGFGDAEPGTSQCPDQLLSLDMHSREVTS